MFVLSTSTTATSKLLLVLGKFGSICTLKARIMLSWKATWVFLAVALVLVGAVQLDLHEARKLGKACRIVIAYNLTHC